MIFHIGIWLYRDSRGCWLIKDASLKNQEWRLFIFFLSGIRLLIKTATSATFVVMIQGSSCLYAGPNPENRETTVLLRPKDQHRPSLAGLVVFVAIYFNYPSLTARNAAT